MSLSGCIKSQENSAGRKPDQDTLQYRQAIQASDIRLQLSNFQDLLMLPKVLSRLSRPLQFRELHPDHLDHHPAPADSYQPNTP